MVLDDGWFGKSSDNCSLGDWYVDKKKLPNGLKGCRAINSYGMKFGLWFEPEMVSPDSDLYRAHPIGVFMSQIVISTARTQLILDYSREDVRNAEVDMTIRGANISYVKWDMNRNMTELISFIDDNRQQETAHRYILGVYEVWIHYNNVFQIFYLKLVLEVVEDLIGILTLCLRLQVMIPMVERLKTQHGTPLSIPSSMTAHVSAVPTIDCENNSIEFRHSVAMAGNLAMS